MLITFIRHSKATFLHDKPITSWGLTDEGIQLAKNLIKTDEIRRINVIYSSLETKALETAEIINQSAGLKVITNKDFCEVTSFSNKVFPEFDKYAQDFFNDKVDRWNNGESKLEALARFNKALNEVIQTETKLGHANIGIVTHGSILTLFIAQYQNSDLWELHKSIKSPDIIIFDASKLAFTRHI